MKALRSIITGGLLAAAALVAIPANAAYVGSIPGGTATNDFLAKYTAGQPVQGWYDADLYLIGGSADITIEFFGAEAGYLNSFWFQNSQLFTHTGGNTFTAAGDSDLTNGVADNYVAPPVTVNGVLSGLLNFLFRVNANPGSQVVNGSNGSNLDALPNFFVTFDNNYVLDTNLADGTASGGQSAFLFLDDGGAGDDDNHDDLVIRLSIKNGGISVPEPGTLALFGLSLLGLGLARRRAN